jgi:hypothetical protein
MTVKQSGPRRGHQPELVERAGQSVYVHGPGSSTELTEVTRLTDPAASLRAGSLIAPLLEAAVTETSDAS